MQKCKQTTTSTLARERNTACCTHIMCHLCVVYVSCKKPSECVFCCFVLFFCLQACNCSSLRRWELVCAYACAWFHIFSYCNRICLLFENSHLLRSVAFWKWMRTTLCCSLWRSPSLMKWATHTRMHTHAHTHDAYARKHAYSQASSSPQLTANSHAFFCHQVKSRLACPPFYMFKHNHVYLIAEVPFEIKFIVFLLSFAL
jgi:hypothetical protein